MDNFQIVILDEHPITLIETEAQGPPGSIPRLTAAAGESLLPYQIIRSDVSGTVFLADSSHDVGDILGTTISPALVGELVSYVTYGLNIPLAGAVPGARYYLGHNGQFTEIVPDDGLLVLVGLCINQDFILLQPPTPVIRRRAWQ